MMSFADIQKMLADQQRYQPAMQQGYGPLGQGASGMGILGQMVGGDQNLPGFFGQQQQQPQQQPQQSLTFDQLRPYMGALNQALVQGRGRSGRAMQRQIDPQQFGLLGGGR